MNPRPSLHILLLLLLAFSSCTHKKTYEYEVDSITVEEPGTDKPSSKTTLEFVSIAYYDLFGKNITQKDLVNLNTVYAAFGDKKLIEDMIIRNFLKRPDVKIPSLSEMKAAPESFVTDTYRKFYNRPPSPAEKWFMNNLLATDNSITPEIVYYTFLTSNEYRNY
jgi:hypothetical protein